MARSLTVKHDEKPATNPLLTGFLLLAVTVLVLGGLFAAPAESEADSTQSNLPEISDS